MCFVPLLDSFRCPVANAVFVGMLICCLCSAVLFYASPYVHYGHTGCLLFYYGLGTHSESLVDTAWKGSEAPRRWDIIICLSIHRSINHARVHTLSYFPYLIHRLFISSLLIPHSQSPPSFLVLIGVPDLDYAFVPFHAYFRVHVHHPPASP